MHSFEIPPLRPLQDNKQDRPAVSPNVDTEGYPENHMDFAPEYEEPIPESWQRFFDLREEMLIGYGYNTARAYWSDLQDIFEWAVERGKDPLDLSASDLKQYSALMRRRKYAESTIRRRMVALSNLTHLKDRGCLTNS